MNDPAARKTILVVDDESALLSMTAARLEHWGYAVLTKTSGEAAILAAKAQRPDVILLDTLMPDMKGRDVCARLKGDPSTQSIPVIFLTALELPDHIKAGLDAGAEDYLVKPVDPNELRRRIELCLSRHQPSAER